MKSTPRAARVNTPPEVAAQPSLFPEIPPATCVQAAIRLSEANVARTVPPGIVGVYFLKAVAAGGRVSEAGIRTNVSVALQYLDAWLGGNGAAAINNLMEDAATAEISRSQL